MPENNNTPTHTDLLVALEGIRGDVKGLRGLVEAQATVTGQVHVDHEDRLRAAEKSIQQGRGVIGFLFLAVAGIGAVGAWATTIN